MISACAPLESLPSANLGFMLLLNLPLSLWGVRLIVYRPFAKRCSLLLHSRRAVSGAPNLHLDGFLI